MAEDRSNQSLHVYKNYDNEPVPVNGGEEGVGEVEIDDVEPGTKVEKGTYLVSWIDDYTFVESEKVDVPGFEVPGEPGEPEEPNIAVSGVTLDKKSVTLDVGKSTKLTVTVSPDNATNKSYTWDSDNIDVALIDQDGNVTAGNPGTATITVTTVDGSKTATCKVTVKEPVVHVTGVDLDKKTLEVEKGATATLKATVTPSNATNKGVNWASDNEKVATVDSKGVVTGVAKGTANIKVGTKDGNKAAQCAVTVKEPVVKVTGVDLDKKTLEVEEGATAQLKATVHPGEATNKAVTWKSGNDATATVDNNGKVTGVKKGTCNVVVTTKDGSKTAQCAVTVTAKSNEEGSDTPLVPSDAPADITSSSFYKQGLADAANDEITNTKESSIWAENYAQYYLGDPDMPSIYPPDKWAKDLYYVYDLPATVDKDRSPLYMYATGYSDKVKALYAELKGSYKGSYQTPHDPMAGDTAQDNFKKAAAAFVAANPDATKQPE